MNEIEQQQPGQQPVFHEVVPEPKGRPSANLSRRRLQFMTVLAATVLVAALGYFVWYKPSRPDMILARSLMQTLQVQSAQFKLAGKISSNSFNLSGSGSARGIFDVSGNYTAKSGAIQLEARSTDAQDVFVKFNGLSSLSTVLGPQAAQYGISTNSNPFKKLDGTWLVIPKEAKNALLKNTQADVVPVATTLSNNDKRSVAEAYQQHPFVAVIKTLPDEITQSTVNHHYQARIDKDELSAFAKDVQKSVPTLKLDDQKIASIQKANISSQPFEVWIAKESGYISKLKTVDNKSKTSIQLDLSDYNKPIDVTKPQGAKPLFEALGSVILGG